MRRQLGASSLFLVVMVAIAVVVATWLALPWITASRNEKIERDLNRGVATPAQGAPSKAVLSPAEASEQAQAAEFADAYRKFESLVGTDRYGALSPRCHELVERFVNVVQGLTDPSSVSPAVRTTGLELARQFDSECAPAPAK